MDLRNNKGHLVHLGNPLTRAGGEGQVFEIKGQSNIVAKVYHKPVEPSKSNRLKFQVKSTNPKINSIAAWPIELLFDESNRNVIRGITMPLKFGKEIHRLYGPADRSTEFPRARWDFLVHVAMNCAAAFETLHENQIVMADVNEGNILVTENDGLVALIDCDSYQITNGNDRFLCDVGVPMWTPPELQGKGFRDLIRTPNHDRFGLAVLVFRLLFMGRHPFAGIPSTKDQFDIDESIKRYLFAFSPSVWKKGLKQPPHSLSLSALPGSTQQLFERSFGDCSSLEHSRPTGREWVAELKRLLDNVKSSCLDPSHIHWNGMVKCPWCHLTTSGGPNFFISFAVHVKSTHRQSDFKLIWLRIEKVISSPVLNQILSLPTIGKATAKLMPCSKPIPPKLKSPTEPIRPSYPEKPKLAADPEIPAAPSLQAPVDINKTPIGHHEKMFYILVMGAAVFGVFSGLSFIFNLELVNYVSSGAFLLNFFICLVKMGPAQVERLFRLKNDQFILTNSHRNNLINHNTLMELHKLRISKLEEEHAVKFKEMKALHQSKCDGLDLLYSQSYNSYMIFKNAFIAEQDCYHNQILQWDLECKSRIENEAKCRYNLNSTFTQFQSQVNQFRSAISQIKPSLENAKLRFEAARNEEIGEMRKLHAHRREVQLNQFLSRKLIRDTEIPNIGTGRKSTLAAYGINSAADIKANLRVPGFGDVLLNNLKVWRQQCEAVFNYNSNLPLPVSEVNAIKIKYIHIRKIAIDELRNHSIILDKMEIHANNSILKLKDEVKILAVLHAQSLADISLCG